MTDKLPPNLLALFAPRPGLRYINPTDHPQQERRTHDIEGVGAYVDSLKDHEDDYQPTESWLQKRDRVKTERKEATEKNMTEGFEAFKPSEDPQVRGDPLRTLFVSRLSYDTETKDLEREFGRYGPIERVQLLSLIQTCLSFRLTTHLDSHRREQNRPRKRHEKAKVPRLRIHSVRARKRHEG